MKNFLSKHIGSVSSRSKYPLFADFANFPNTGKAICADQVIRTLCFWARSFRIVSKLATLELMGVNIGAITTARNNLRFKDLYCAPSIKECPD
ncbi:hypothetical protein Tco_1437350 [Tanacetum coccineum]